MDIKKNTIMNNNNVVDTVSQDQLQTASTALKVLFQTGLMVPSDTILMLVKTQKELEAMAKLEQQLEAKDDEFPTIEQLQITVLGIKHLFERGSRLPLNNLASFASVARYFELLVAKRLPRQSQICVHCRKFVHCPCEEYQKNQQDEVAIHNVEDE